MYSIVVASKIDPQMIIRDFLEQTDSGSSIGFELGDAVLQTEAKLG